MVSTTGCRLQHSSSWWASCYGLSSGADAAEAAALLAGQLCGAARPRRPRRRWRCCCRALALAATAVNHCVFVRVVSLLLVAAPGSLLLRFAYYFVFLNAVAVDMHVRLPGAPPGRKKRTSY